MKTVQISLNSIDKVKSFVNAITQFEFDFDLISGRYVIDAKSIMGIFSLDLSKPIDLAIHAESNLDEGDCESNPFFYFTGNCFPVKQKTLRKDAHYSAST